MPPTTITTTTATLSRLLILILSTIFLSCFATSQKTTTPTTRIEQVFIVSRHCDRTPISDIELPNEPVNWVNHLGIAQGQLTGLGIAQCFHMGQHLRSRYLLPNSPHQIRDITHHQFDSEQFKLTSTSVDRTIISLNAVSQALFPNGTGLKNDINDNKPSLLGDISLVPVHTIPEHEDVLLRGFERCPTIDHRLTNLYSSAQFLKLQREYAPLMEMVANVTGREIRDFRDYYWVYDVLVVQKSHQMLKRLEVLLDEDNWSRIQELGNLVNYLKYTRKLQQNLGAGPLMQTVLDSFSKVVTDHTREKVKYIHMSAHDSTLESIFATLDIDGMYPELQGVPPYGSQIIFELHRDDETKEYSVQVVIRLGYDADFVAYPLGGKCSNQLCTWNTFKSHIKAKSALSIQSWCQKCNNDFTSFCTVHLLNKKRSENTVLLISVPIISGICFISVALLAILYMRHRKNYYKYTSLP